VARSDRKTSTTSFAVLGLLAVRSWSAYELTKQVRRSLRYCWPRAEARIYDEPKQLVARGWAKSTEELTGRRKRTVYEITPEGRESLRDWMHEAPTPTRFESDALLRVVFAEHGTKESLLATLAAFEADALEMHQNIVALAEEYLGGEGPYRHRLHVIGLAGILNLSQYATAVEWARWAQEQVANWTDVDAPEHAPVDLSVYEPTLRRLGPRPPSPS
jgi:DNA-binding PadR family transcriptional regulator